ncbi:hypothetical protein EJ110_NYTH40816 [Nymphaea thermarum]|nr:hypothetical protein EJ110_NYTH40816 [Nymphaea thermarum]
MEADSSYSPNPYEEDQFDEDEQYSESQSCGQSGWEHYEELSDDYGEHSLNEQPNEPYQFSYEKVWFEPTKFHSQTPYPSSSHITGNSRYEKHDQSPKRYHNPHGRTTLTRNKEEDLVLSSYKGGIHRRYVTLIHGTELEKGPSLRCLLAGRSPKCDLVFRHPNIQDYHFKLVIERGSRKMWVSNETKRGSLQVAGYEIKPRCYMQIYPGEILKLGDMSRDYKLEWVTPISTQTYLSKSNIKGEHVEARRDVGLCLKENKLQRSSNIPSKVPSNEVQGNQPLGDMKCQILQLQENIEKLISNFKKERQEKSKLDGSLVKKDHSPKKLEVVTKHQVEEGLSVKGEPSSKEGGTNPTLEEESIEPAGLCMVNGHKQVELSRMGKMLPKEGGTHNVYAGANQFLKPSKSSIITPTIPRVVLMYEDEEGMKKESWNNSSSPRLATLEPPHPIRVRIPTWGRKLSWLKRRQLSLDFASGTILDLAGLHGKVNDKADHIEHQGRTWISSSLHEMPIEHPRIGKAWLQVRMIFDPGTHEPRLVNPRRLKWLHMQLKSQLGKVPRDYGPTCGQEDYKEGQGKSGAAEAWKRRVAIGGNRLSPFLKTTAQDEQHVDESKRLQGQVFDRGRTCQNPTWGDHAWAKHLQGHHESLLGSLPRDYGPHPRHGCGVSELSPMSWNELTQSTLDDCEGRAWGQARCKEGGVDTSLLRARTSHIDTSAEGARICGEANLCVYEFCEEQAGATSSKGKNSREVNFRSFSLAFAAKALSSGVGEELREAKLPKTSKAFSREGGVFSCRLIVQVKRERLQADEVHHGVVRAWSELMQSEWRITIHWEAKGAKLGGGLDLGDPDPLGLGDEGLGALSLVEEDPDSPSPEEEDLGPFGLDDGGLGKVRSNASGSGSSMEMSREANPKGSQQRIRDPRRIHTHEMQDGSKIHEHEIEDFIWDPGGVPKTIVLLLFKSFDSFTISLCLSRFCIRLVTRQVRNRFSLCL